MIYETGNGRESNACSYCLHSLPNTFFYPCIFCDCIPCFHNYSRDGPCCKTSKLDDGDIEQGFSYYEGSYECCFGFSCIAYLCCCLAVPLTCIFYPLIRYKIFNDIFIEYSYCICCDKVLFHNMQEHT